MDHQGNSPNPPHNQVKEILNAGPSDGGKSLKSGDGEHLSKGSRVRSASTGRDDKSEMCSRYWGYLFQNLDRSLSEIYQECQKEQNLPQSKQVLLILENHSRDFKNLIQWLNVNWNYENSSPYSKPSSLTWEVRKTTFPLFAHNVAKEKLVCLENWTVPPCTGVSISEIQSVVGGEEESCHGSPKTHTNTLLTTQLISTVHIGLQTDLEEDPDIYYFAGGRTVACQTHYCEEYGPLVPLPSNPSPLIMVLNTSDSDMESSIGQESNPFVCSTTKHRTKPISESRKSSPSIPALCENNWKSDITPTTMPDANNLKRRPPTPLGTKSSATQLSAGVLIDEIGRDDLVALSKQPTMEDELSGDDSRRSQKEKKSPTPPKSTFAEKAKTALFRQIEMSTLNSKGRTVAKSRGPIGSASRGAMKGKVPSIPNYRSNIASRCRTAVNTSTQQSQRGKGSGWPQWPGVTRSKSMVNPILGKGGRRGSVFHSNISLPDSSVDEDGWETVKARSNRSKWSSSNTSLASSNPNQSRSSLEKVVPLNAGHSTDSKGDVKKAEGKKGFSEDDGSVHDEEMKRKEADLDDAIREEELLEQELLQVEKDFERIERTEDVTITDSEHATSPELLDLDLENENFFFVRMDDEEVTRMEELPPRETGRILSLREKLMSPAKKCDGAERLQRYEAKLAKAERNRGKLLQSKFNRYVELSERFEALNETTKKLVAERAELIVKAEERRRRAGEKRTEYLKSIRRKAHDEDSKAKEIAFINLLEAQNKRHDYFASAQEVEERLGSIQEERRVKLEERAGKASGVIERQCHIRKEWQAKLIEFQEKRRKADERIRREKEERTKERTEMAIEKARDREVRISALNAAKKAEKEELEKKIRQKQEDTARRHEENMEQIRQKAMEFSAPRVMEDNSGCIRICTLCKISMQSEVQELGHVRGRAHLDAVKKSEGLSSSAHSRNARNGSHIFGLKFIALVQPEKFEGKITGDKNRQKGAKKHSKKLMERLMESGREFEKTEVVEREAVLPSDSALLAKTRKNILDLARLIHLFEKGKGSGTAATSMDRLIAEIRRAAVKSQCVKESVIRMNGVGVAQRVLQCTATDLPLKVKVSVCEMLQGFVLGNLRNGLYILRATTVCTIMNLCVEQWQNLIPEDSRWWCGSPTGIHQPLPTDPLIEALVALLFNLLGNVPDPFQGVMRKGSSIDPRDIQAIKSRTHDIIGYLVASGVIDRISVYCGGVRGPVDSQPGVASLLQILVDFLVVLVYALQFCWGEDPTGCIMSKKEPDVTQLLGTLEASELAGAVSMSYSLLLHQGAPSRPRTGHLNPPAPPETTALVVKSTLCLINAMARLDLMALQSVLGSEAVSLQFRHIVSQLLWQVVPHRESYSMRRLLTELIIAIGNFTVGNKENQRTIQSGQTPTVLQMLCTLPAEYFEDSKYCHNFLPTLLAATHASPENGQVLIENKIEMEMLEKYVRSEEGKNNVMVKRLLSLQGHSGKRGLDKKRPLEQVNQIILSSPLTCEGKR